MKTSLHRKTMIFCFTLVLFGLGSLPTILTSSSTDYQLPPPTDVDMILEESIFRRCSVREFSTDPISDEDLSTILWAAYGYRDDGKRTVPPIDGVHGCSIYVLRKDESFNLDVYMYNASDHSLQFYKEISSVNFGQYTAPVYIGIVWDMDKSENENYVGAEIGEICQNIHFMVSALELGTVVNADTLPWAHLAKIDLPPNEVPRIIMPIGYPKYSYDFRYQPWDFSPLPRIQVSDMSLTTAIEQRNESQLCEGQLTFHEQTQMIWSSYGYSYLLDRTETDFGYHIDRHRTVPSAHGYYPLRIYACTESSICQYHANVLLYLTPRPFIDFYGLPVLSIMQKVVKGDFREELAQACSQPSLATAPLSIISVLDLERTRPKGGDDLSGERYQWVWYYEAGASAQNMFLEAASWDLSVNVELPTDATAIRSLLKLDDDFIPLFVVSVGE